MAICGIEGGAYYPTGRTPGKKELVT